MDRKQQCERIFLTKSERKLLKQLDRRPHAQLSKDVVGPLLEMGLVVADTKGADPFNRPLPTGTYCVSELYRVYQAYLADRCFWLSLKSLWLPIVVSVITTLTVTGLQWSLPRLIQWLTSSL